LKSNSWVDAVSTIGDELNGGRMARLNGDLTLLALTVRI